MKPGKTKKVIFYETDKRHADLKIRLHYDGLSQQEFFSSIISAYLEKDNNLVSVVIDLKEQKLVHSKNKRKQTKNMYKKSQETKQKFALEEKEVESIYDIIQEELNI